LRDHVEWFVVTSPKAEVHLLTRPDYFRKRDLEVSRGIRFRTIPGFTAPDSDQNTRDGKLSASILISTYHRPLNRREAWTEVLEPPDHPCADKDDAQNKYNPD